MNFFKNHTFLVNFKQIKLNLHVLKKFLDYSYF